MRKVRNERGQTVVEFTLMLPFLLFFMFALVEFGFGFYTHIAVRNAAAEAARHAAVGNIPNAACTAPSIENRAIQAGNGLISCNTDGSTIEVGYRPVDNEVTRGGGVVVRVTQVYPEITPLRAIASMISWGVVPEEWTLTACAEARLETRPTFPNNYTPNTTLSCGG